MINNKSYHTLHAQRVTDPKTFKISIACYYGIPDFQDFTQTKKSNNRTIKNKDKRFQTSISLTTIIEKDK